MSALSQAAGAAATSAPRVAAAGEVVLRIDQVIARIGLSRTSIYDAIKAGTFPKPIKLSKQARGWLKSEIDQWLADLAAGRKS